MAFTVSWADDLNEPAEYDGDKAVVGEHGELIITVEGEITAVIAPGWRDAAYTPGGDEDAEPDPDGGEELTDINPVETVVHLRRKTG